LTSRLVEWARRSRAAPLAIGLLAVAPGLVWAMLDREVWTWDPSYYGDAALRLHLLWQDDRARWLHEMLHLFGGNAPGIAWLGQWLAPLGRLLGSPERALMLASLGANAATVAIAFDLVRAAGGAALPALAAGLFVGAAPLYVVLSTRFLVEPWQALAVAGFLRTAVRSRSASRLTTLAMLMRWTTLALLAKVSTPLYVVVPAAVALWNLGRARSWLSPDRREARARFLVGNALWAGLAALTLAWYAINLGTAWRFARAASSGAASQIYGTRAPFAHKLGYWLYQVIVGMSWRPLWAAPLVLALLGLVWRRAVPTPAPRWIAAMALAQMALVLAVLSLNINEDPRFIYATLPCAGVVGGVLVGWLGARAAAAWAALLVGQLAVVQAAAFGWTNRAPEFPHMFALDRGGAHARVLDELVAATAPTGQRVFIAAEVPWMNRASYQFAARKRGLSGAAYPTVAGLGTEIVDGETAWARLLATRPRWVVAYESPPPAAAALASNVNVPYLIGRMAGSHFAARHLAGDPSLLLFEHRAPCSDGTFVKGDGDTIFLVENGALRALPDWPTFLAHDGHADLSNVARMSDAELAEIPEAAPLPPAFARSEAKAQFSTKVF
jgi:hypothetical protein